MVELAWRETEAHDRVTPATQSREPAGAAQAIRTCALTEGDDRYAALYPNRRDRPAGNARGPSGVYDPVRQRMIVFGGQPDLVVVANSTPQVWELSLAGTPSWTALTTWESPGP